MSTGLTSAGAVQWVGGSWVAAVTPRGVMLLPPTADDAVVTDLWELLRAEGTSMVDLMDALLGSSGGHIGSLPEFAAVLSGEAEAMHVMVRGRPVVFVDGTKLNCEGVETWYETTLQSGQDVRVVAPEELTGRTRPVVDAIVSAAALLLGGAKIDGDIIPKAPEPAALAAEAQEATAAETVADAEPVEAERTEAEASEDAAAESQAQDEFLDAPVPAPAQVEEHVPASDETIMAPRIDIDGALEVAENLQYADSADRVVDAEPLESALTSDQIDEVDELSALGADAEPAEGHAEAAAESGKSADSAASADEADDVETDKAEADRDESAEDDEFKELDELADQLSEGVADKADASAELTEEATDHTGTLAEDAEAEEDEHTRGRPRFGKRVKAAAAAAAAAAAGLVAHDSAEAEEAAEAGDVTEVAALKDLPEGEKAEAQPVEEAAAEQAAEAADAVEESAEMEAAAAQSEETAVLPVRPTTVGHFPDDEIEYEYELEPGMAVVDDFDEGEVHVVTPAAKPAQSPQVAPAEEPQDVEEDGEAVSSTIISHTVDQDLPQALLAELDAEFGVDLDSPSTNELYEDRYVLACPCPKGHANPTSRSKCRICGEDLVLPAQRMVCPALGTVTMSSGEVISLDRDLVVGRQPDVTSFAMGDVPPLAVVVPSPERLISRNHVHIMLEEWAVLVEDLATRNGTILCRDGEDPVRMAPGTSVLIRNGDELVLGDGQSLVFEDLP